MVNGNLLEDENVQIKHCSISSSLFSDIPSFILELSSNKAPIYLLASNRK